MTQGANITRFIFERALHDYFHSDVSEMASRLGCSSNDLESAISENSVRIRFKVFEKLAKYCLDNHLSMDSLLYPYAESVSAGPSNVAQTGEADENRML